MSNEIPIIGENKIDASPDESPMRLVQKAFMMIQQPDGRWIASSDIATFTESFSEVTPEDVMWACQRVRETLLAEEQAAMQTRMQMMMAKQVQETMQNQQLIQSLKF